MTTAERSLRAEMVGRAGTVFGVGGGAESGTKRGCNPHPPHPGAYAICSQAPGVQVTTPFCYPRLPHVLNKMAYRTRRSIIGSDLTRLSLAQGASKGGGPEGGSPERSLPRLLKTRAQLPVESNIRGNQKPRRALVCGVQHGAILWPGWRRHPVAAARGRPGIPWLSHAEVLGRD